MRIYSVAVAHFFLLVAEMLTIHASALKHIGNNIETTKIVSRGRHKHSTNINLAALPWYISEHKTDASDCTTTKNKIDSKTLTFEKPHRNKETYPKLKNHRFRRKAHFHYKTGQSFQHYRKHHLKVTTQAFCNRSANFRAFESTHVNCQVNQTTHVKTKRTTQKPKSHMWKKLSFLKVFSFPNASASPDEDLKHQENKSSTESIEKDAKKITSPMRSTTEDTHTNQTTSKHVSTSHTTITPNTTSLTNTTHSTKNMTNATSNSSSIKETQHTTESPHIFNGTESVTTTEKHEKKLLNWLLHPHISHKHIVPYELENKYYMAVLVVADKSFVEYHRNTDYDTYILTVMNMAADYMRDVTLGVNLQLVIARTIYLGGETKAFEKDEGMGPRLEQFCDWAQKINPKDANHPSYHDVAILITRLASPCKKCTCKPLGAAYAGGACADSKSCLLVQDRGLMMGVTVAHQLGHLLGAPHDDDPECQSASEEVDNSTTLLNHVMSTSPEYGSLVWSNCSRRFVTSFFRQGMASCLEDEPPKSLVTFPEVLPGVMYDADQQCNMLVRGSRACFITSMEFCAKLFCRTSTTACYYNGDRPAQGTPCGVNKWCWNGKCVRRGWRPLAVSGGWNAWGGWSACSRSCGGGVQRASRACATPPPRAGGRHCAGDAVRHRTCHIQPCKPKAPSFRAVQCSAFNHVPVSGSRYLWRPLARAADPCGLYCASGTGVNLRLRPRAADGTPCRPGANDLCIDGTCMRVGCDWAIDSSVSEDRCGVCGGDGVHCHLVEAWYNVTNATQLGYQLITVIPKGSRKIRIFEACSSTNDLAISNVTTKKEKETFFLIGNKSANAEGEFMIQTVRGLHTNSESGKDFVLINGPLPTAIKIYVIIQGKNGSIYYSYMDIHVTAHVEKKNAPNDKGGLERRQRNPFLERNNPLHWSRYQWEHLEWGSCSARCQVGKSVCSAHCMSVWFGQVSDSYCIGTKKPRDLVRVCNEQACRARWQTGSWSECYNCKQWRYVQCMREGRSYSSPSMPVDSRCCHDKRPQTSKRCQDSNGLLRNCSKDSIVMTDTDTFTTPFYLDMLGAEKWAPSRRNSMNEYITPGINFNIIQSKKDTEATENVLQMSGYNSTRSMNVHDDTDVPLSSLSVEEIAMSIQEVLENSTASTVFYSHSSLNNIDPENVSESAIMATSNGELETVEPRINRSGIEIIKLTGEQVDTPVPTLYSDDNIGIMKALKSKDVISLQSPMVSEFITQKTITNSNPLTPSTLENYNIFLKPKLYPIKKSILSELKNLIFSKSIEKREVMENSHDNLQNVDHLDEKHANTKAFSEFIRSYSQKQENEDYSYISLYLSKDCIHTINNILNNMGVIKLILRDGYSRNTKANHSNNKISTGVEDTYGNKIYDFDDILHFNSINNLTNCSKDYFYKKFNTNEFVTKIPLKLLNTVVSFGGSMRELTDETQHKKLKFLTLNNIVPTKNSSRMSDKAFPFATTTTAMSNYLNNVYDKIPNNIEKRNETICLDPKRDGVGIRSLYNSVNIYCANVTLINESMTQLRNEINREYSALSNHNPWNINEDKYNTNESLKGLNINNNNNYFIEIPLSPTNMKTNEHGLGFLTKYKRIFRKNKNNNHIHLRTVHPRHFRSVRDIFNFEKKNKGIRRSEVSATTKISSSHISNHLPTRHRPETVTPKGQQNNINFNRKTHRHKEPKGTTGYFKNKLLASSNKREAEIEVTKDPHKSVNASISEITNTERTIVLFSNFKIVTDFVPIYKIPFEKMPITGIKYLLNNLTEISNRELGDEIPTFIFGREFSMIQN